MLKDIIFYDIYRKSWKKADLEFIECIEEKWKSEKVYTFSKLNGEILIYLSEYEIRGIKADLA